MLFFIIASSAVIYGGIVSWKKNKDRNFLFFTFGGLILGIFGIWNYSNEDLFDIMNLLVLILVASTNWYYWKVYQARWVLNLFWVLVVASLYPLYKIVNSLF